MNDAQILQLCNKWDLDSEHAHASKLLRPSNKKVQVWERRGSGVEDPGFHSSRSLDILTIHNLSYLNLDLDQDIVISKKSGELQSSLVVQF